jgi:hypothetical protein
LWPTNYDALPDRVAFVHGHERAWHQRHERGMLEVIARASPDYDYVPLNNLYRMLSPLNIFTDSARAHAIPIGAQFVVTRNAIQRTSLADWTRILDSLLQPVLHPLQDFNKGLSFEALSHTLFGAPLDLQPRSEWFSFEHKPVWWTQIKNAEIPHKFDEAAYSAMVHDMDRFRNRVLV